MKLIKILTIILVFFISCNSQNVKTKTENYYEKVYKYILNDFHQKEIYVSNYIYSQKLSDFMKANAIIANEELLNKIELNERKNEFEIQLDQKIYSSLNYVEPKIDNLPILFFSKPKNDSLIVEVFTEYQNSNYPKDYFWFGKSKLYLFDISKQNIKLLSSFQKKRN